MKSQKIITNLLGSILGVLVLTLGITFAVFTYQQTGTSNNQLVLGDIYMHYQETNQLKMENAMPTKGIQKLVTGYLVNPIMAEQDASDTFTELYACINLFQNEWDWDLDEGEDFESFCRGTGTNWGWTLQMYLDEGFGEDDYNELLSLKIIKEKSIEYTSIKLNPDIANQTTDYENELTACVSLFQNSSIDEGSTAETFCKGTGTYYGGILFQDNLDDNSFDDGFIQEMLSLNIIQENGKSYVINPDMANQTVGEINELMTCVSLVTLNGYEFDEGTTAESFCKGEGTAWGGITLKKEFEDYLDDIEYMLYSGNDLLENNIILTERNLPYFEFTISGKNTYTKKDIYYDVLLSHGNTLENKLEENRIKDNFLRFSLYEILDDNTEKNIFLNKSYSSLENKSIHVETIPKNTMNEINKTYRLYMWIDNDVVIGNVGEDYTPEEWKNVFASIKVSVKGDFLEKELETSENCFNAVKRLGDFTLNTSEEAINKCIAYVESKQTDGEFSSENTIEDYCRGTGIRKNYYARVYTGDFTIREDLLFDTRKATSKMSPHFMADDIKYFINEHIIENVEYVAQVISYDNNCGSNVIIPKKIGGYLVTILGHDLVHMETIFLERLTDNLVVNAEFYLPYFLGGGNFSKVVIPNTIKEVISTIFVNAEIEELEFEVNSQLEAFGNLTRGLFYGDAFLANNIKTNNLKLPDSITKLASGAIGLSNIRNLDLNNVEKIENEALAYSTINELIIGNKIKYIDDLAFLDSQIDKLTIDKTCDEIKNIQASETDTTLYYPWGLSTIYGSGGEVCEIEAN